MATITTLAVDIVGKTDKLNHAFDQADNRISGFARSASRAGVALAKIGAAGIAAGAAIVGAFAVKSIGAFMDFDAAMNESLAIMGDVSDETRKKMEMAAREVAKTTVHSATDAANGYYFLASAGFTAEQAIAALPQVAAFAQAGMFDLEKATEYATDSVAALGLKSNDAQQNLVNLTRVTDVLTEAANRSNASVEQFAEALTNKAGAALRLVNKDVEEGVAVLSVFADQGLKGAGAGEALNIVTRDLQRAALDNADAFTAAGIAVYDNTGKMRNYADIVSDMEHYFDGMSDAQKRQAITDLGFQDRSVSNILLLMGMSDKIREYEANLRQAGGTTQEVADKQMESLRNRLTMLKSKFDDVMLSVGGAFAPVISQAVDAISKKMDEVTPIIEDFGKKLTEIWERKDLTITAKLEASWEEFGRLNKTTAEIKQNMEGVSYVFLSVAHAVMGLANLFGVALYLGASLGSSLVVIFAGAAVGVMESINAIAGGLQAIGAISDEDAQKVQDWADATKTALDKANSNYEDSLTAAERSSAAATEHFKQMGLDFNSSIEAFTAPKPIIDGGPLANVKTTTAADVEWLKADLAAGGRDMTAGLGRGMWDQLPVVNRAAGAAKTTAATAADVNLNPAGASITTGMGMGMWAGKPSVDGAAGALRGSAASAGNINLYSAGVNIAQGLADGIAAGSYAVGQAAIGLVNAAQEKANAAAQNHSPSKVFRRIGNFLSKGMALGIIDGVPAVEKAASMLVPTSAMNGMQYQPAMAGSGMGSASGYLGGPAPTTNNSNTSKVYKITVNNPRNYKEFMRDLERAERHQG